MGSNYIAGARHQQDQVTICIRRTGTPFKTVLSGDRAAIAKLTTDDLLKILGATLTGMSVDEFEAETKNWLETARDPRWKRPYTDLTYVPMNEVLTFMRSKGYKT